MKVLSGLVLLVAGCTSVVTTQSKYKPDDTPLTGDHTYFMEASADNLSDARMLAYRTMNLYCPNHLKVQSEIFEMTSQKATVKVQFTCVADQGKL